MSALIIRLPEEKRTRLKLVAKSRKVSVTKLLKRWPPFYWQISMPKHASSCVRRGGVDGSPKVWRCSTKQRGNAPARSVIEGRRSERGMIVAASL